MRPSRPPSGKSDLFRERLEAIIDLGHPLVRLAGLVPWSRFEDSFGRFYRPLGPPAKPTRLMVGLHYLKHVHDLSDEEVVARWVENLPHSDASYIWPIQRQRPRAWVATCTRSPSSAGCRCQCSTTTTDVFGFERLTGALLDRLTHYVSILDMNGDRERPLFELDQCFRKVPRQWLRKFTHARAPTLHPCAELEMLEVPAATLKRAKETRLSGQGPTAGRTHDEAARDHATVALIERVLLVLLLGAAFAGLFLVMQPFAVSILFGASLATATWPLRQAFVRHGLGYRSTAFILLVLSLCLIGVPVLIAAPHLADQLREGAERVQSHFASAPKQPAWLANLPLIGAKLSSIWDRLVEVEGDLGALSAPYAANIEEVIFTAARALRDTVVQLILSLVMATVFWARGETLVAVLHDVLRRIGGLVGEHVLDVAAAAIRGVAYGVVGTAVIQATLLTVGLAAAGVPGAGMLGFVGLLIAISQIGAPLLIGIWGGAAWWLFEQDHQVWGTAMIGWGIFVSTIDNLIKPFLIGQGIQMPLSLTILGVFGGFIAFGFLGLFIGPTLIAVLFNLLQAWRVAATAASPDEG